MEYAVATLAVKPCTSWKLGYLYWRSIQSKTGQVHLEAMHFVEHSKQNRSSTPGSHAFCGN